MSGLVGRQPGLERRGIGIHSVLRVLNVAVRAAFIVIGILLIGGWFQLRYIKSDFRILVGVIFVLYGVFRIATLWLKGKGDERP